LILNALMSQEAYPFLFYCHMSMLDIWEKSGEDLVQPRFAAFFPEGAYLDFL